MYNPNSTFSRPTPQDRDCRRHRNARSRASERVSEVVAVMEES